MYHKETMSKGGKMRDNNLANNYPPYDKITRGDVIAGRLGKDQMGGKNKMAKGGNAEKEYVVTLQNSDSGELMKINVMGTSEDNAVDNAYMEAGVNKDYEVYSVKKMAKGGNMKKGQAYKMYEITKEGLNGQYSYYSDKQGKTIKADTREEILREIEKEKKMAKGGKMYAKGGEVPVENSKMIGKTITIQLPTEVKPFKDKVIIEYGDFVMGNKGFWSKEHIVKKSEGGGIMAKGGKTKKGKQDPPVIRGYVDDEPYEYGDGGTMNCWCYDIGGL